jgi:C1A family cysteine protease
MDSKEFLSKYHKYGHKTAGYGWKPDLPDIRDLSLSVAQEDLQNLPSSVDLTSGFPAPYDQGQLGSCTANALAAAYEFDLKKQGLTDFTPSRLFIYYNERNMEGSVSEDAGAMIRDGAKSIGKLGVCPETEWPYNVKKFADVPPQKAFQDALSHTAIKYQRVKRELPYLKSCLASGYPFVFGFTVYESFESDEVAKTGIVDLPKKTEQVLGGHAVIACGYDNASQRFRVRNSWGSGWAENGYFTMPYQYVTNHGLASDFWVIEAVSS